MKSITAPVATPPAPLSLTALRGGATYTDSKQTSAATLAVLKDDKRTTNGVTYQP